MTREPSSGGSSKRVREWRERQRRHAIVLSVEIDHTTIEMMMEIGMLDEKGSQNRKMIARQITVFFRNALADRVREER